MKMQEPARQPVEANHKGRPLQHWSRLQMRMTLASVGAFLVSIISSQVLVGIFLFILFTDPSFYGLHIPAEGVDYFWMIIRYWLLGDVLFLLLFIAPITAFFATLMTRGPVQRIHRLVDATARFASGDYTQRIAASRPDEIGQLERQFNSMAQQLVESIAQQRVLVEQQTRLEERARLEQELRTAQNIQRALLPATVPALPGWHFTLSYEPAREVGGDFYDFIALEDDRLGIVIGDAAGKGIPAALLMTTTCTMLRTASHASSVPGQVLARVNDLLATRIPPGIFVTCFYAILDPASGLMRYANAGHEWPYRQHSTSLSELQATGMPLGMMPGTQYEDQEVALTCGESLFFYSDGLVEAHNQQREMFGRPRLTALLTEQSDGTSLIDVVRSELATFTGPAWEQEDDITLLLLRRT